MQFSFESNRLRVFSSAVSPWPDRPESKVYLAFYKTPGAAQTVAHAIVTDMPGLADFCSVTYYCEIIEVSDMFRGQGYGRELFLAIEESLGAQMAAVAVTEQGRRMLERMGRPTDSIAASLRAKFSVLTESPHFQNTLEGEKDRFGDLASDAPISLLVADESALQQQISRAPCSTLRTLIETSGIPLEIRIKGLNHILEIFSQNLS